MKGGEEGKDTLLCHICAPYSSRQCHVIIRYQAQSGTFPVLDLIRVSVYLQIKE